MKVTVLPSYSSRVIHTPTTPYPAGLGSYFSISHPITSFLPQPKPELGEPFPLQGSRFVVENDRSQELKELSSLQCSSPLT